MYRIIYLDLLTDVVRCDAKFFALFSCFELVSIAEASAIDKLTALLPAGVIIPRWMISFARTSDFW